MKKIKKYTGILLALTAFVSCKKEYDTPPLHTIPTGYVLTIDSLRNMFQGAPVRFTSDYSVYGVVTADEVDGNLYKNIYVQSGDAAINVRLLNSGGVYIGDSIRIYLKGTVLSKYNGMLQIDSVNVDNNIIKQATGVVVEPLDVNITDLNTSLQSRLVRINNVEFENSELGKTYADAVNQVTENRLLTDCFGNTAMVRTSGFANYAAMPLPSGHGSVTAIVGEFNGDIQLYIRRQSEVDLSAPRCSGEPPILSKNFEDNNITSGGWSMYHVLGTVDWTTNGAGSGHSGDYYGQCTNYTSGSGNEACDTWYISPAVDLSSAGNPVLSFINACNYSGPMLEVKVSSNYTGGDPNTATWTTLSPVLSGGSWSWVGSGNISLSSFVGQPNVRIAFRYTGSASDGKTWELDDIMVVDL